MKDLKGTKTEQNLKEAFAGESQARNKYTFFASAAKEAGFEEIAAIFTETANNEIEHAKLWLKELKGVGSVDENLKTAADGEHGEWTSMYPSMAAEASEEGFDRIAKLFKRVATIEKAHEARYLALLKKFEEDIIHNKEERIVWKCRSCGYSIEGKEVADTCPICLHPKSYYGLEATRER